MTIHRFALQGEFIELNVLLKLLALAQSGGGAKALIADGAVAVDGATETRIRRKLRDGNVVRLGAEEIRIEAAADGADVDPVSVAAVPPQDDAAGDRAPRKRRTSATPSPTRKRAP